MEFSTYVQMTRETAVYPESYERDYVIHGLVDEIGELLETVESAPSGQPVTGAEHTEQICKEMGDCTWYLARLVDHFDFDLSDVRPPNYSRREFDRGKSLVKDNLILAARINGHQKKSVRDDADKEDEIKSAVWRIYKNFHAAVHHFGLYDLNVVLETNLNKLFDRKDRDVIKGDGDER